MDPKSPKIRQIIGKLLGLAFRKPTTNPATNLNENAGFDLLETVDDIDSPRRMYEGRETIDISHHSFDDPSPRVDISQLVDRTHPNYRYSPSSVSLGSAKSHGSSLDSGKGGESDDWHGLPDWHGLQMDCLRGAKNDDVIFSRWFPGQDPLDFASGSSSADLPTNSMDTNNTYPMSNFTVDPSGGSYSLESASDAYPARWPLNPGLSSGALHLQYGTAPQQTQNVNSARLLSTEFIHEYANHTVDPSGSSSSLGESASDAYPARWPLNPGLSSGALHPRHVTPPQQTQNINSDRLLSAELNQDYAILPHLMPGDDVGSTMRYNTAPNTPWNQSTTTGYNSDSRYLRQDGLSDFQSPENLVDPTHYYTHAIPESSTHHNTRTSRPATEYDARTIDPSSPRPHEQTYFDPITGSSSLPPMPEDTFARPSHHQENPWHAGVAHDGRHNSNSHRWSPTASIALNPSYHHANMARAGAAYDGQYTNSYHRSPASSQAPNLNLFSVTSGHSNTSSTTYGNNFPETTHLQNAHGWRITPTSYLSSRHTNDIQAGGSIGPMRTQSSGKLRSAAGSSNPFNPSRRVSSQNLRQDVLKKSLPLTDSEINDIVIALPIWKDVIKKVASEFCKQLVIGPLLIMDVGKHFAWLRSRGMLSEILDTELLNFTLPILPRSLDPLDPGRVDHYIRKMRRKLMLVARTVGKYYHLEPQGISPTDTEAYSSAVCKRVQALLTDSSFMFLDNDKIFHPAIWEGLIDVLWFPEGYGEPIGDTCTSEINPGTPLWLIANFGGIVMHSLASYALLSRVRLSSTPSFEAREYAIPTHGLFNILLAKFNDRVEGPRFRAKLIEWMRVGRERRQAANGASRGKKYVSKRRSQTTA